MNRERKLLQRCLRIVKLTDANILADEVQALLAQPEQTPDYYLWFDEVHEEHPTNEGDDDVMPLYTSPPKRYPLSYDEIKAIGKKSLEKVNYSDVDGDNNWAFRINEQAFARAIEKAHGIGGGE